MRERAIERKANIGTMTIIIIRSHTAFFGKRTLEIIALPNETRRKQQQQRINGTKRIRERE